MKAEVWQECFVSAAEGEYRPSVILGLKKKKNLAALGAKGLKRGVVGSLKRTVFNLTAFLIKY